MKSRDRDQQRTRDKETKKIETREQDKEIKQRGL
jgi:hypothetical protein